MIDGRSVLERTLLTFCHHPFIELIVLVAGSEEIDRVNRLVETIAPYFKKNFIVGPGGETRADSVFCGLNALPPEIEIVLVHDAARPLLSPELIDRVVAGVIHTGAAVPGLPLSDTVKRVFASGNVGETVPRIANVGGETIAGLTAIQTPQGAEVSLLKQAYESFFFAKFEPTDEASLIEAAGDIVEVVPGDPGNIKITRQEDIALAEAYLSAASLPPPIIPARHSLRTGFGYDVHQFAAGRKLWLGGVEIPHDRGLEGHSDADVLLHAICDALLGALSLGDIGILFPNTDPAYKGISSLKLLGIVNMRVKEKGWEVVNIDSMLAAEAPKLLPHREKMQLTIATALGIPPDCISVKATTNETMGFVGRKEGMCCWSVATVRQV